MDHQLFEYCHIDDAKLGACDISRTQPAPDMLSLALLHEVEVGDKLAPMKSVAHE